MSELLGFLAGVNFAAMINNLVNRRYRLATIINAAAFIMCGYLAIIGAMQ